MKISEIIKDKYKLRIPPTVYYDLLADVQEAEEEQEPCEDFKQKAGVVIEQLRADRDRLATALEEIREEVEQITNTMGVSYYPYVSKIEVLQIIDKHRKEGE